jgi:hypothetical protein
LTSLFQILSLKSWRRFFLSRIRFRRDALFLDSACPAYGS